MKFSHFALFDGQNTDRLNWDVLRDQCNESAYYIPFSKSAYIDSVININTGDIGSRIIQYCQKNGLSSIISLGAGRCYLEYHIKMNSNLKVIVTDLSSSILRIKEFEIFDEVYQIDMLNEKILANGNHTLILLSRIDTELEDHEFANLFKILHLKKVKHICLIPAELLNAKIALAEIKIAIKSFISKKRRTFCGYIRTRKEFIKHWSPYYSLQKLYSNSTLFFLTIKDRIEEEI